MILEAKDDTETSNIVGVELSWDGGTTYTSSGFDTGELTTSDVLYTLGGPTNLWGRTWSSTDLSNANFRLRINLDVQGGVAQVDHIQVDVYYRSSIRIRGFVKFR